MDYYGPMMRPYGLVFLFLLALAPAAPAQPATETTPLNSALDDVLLYQLLVAEFSQNEGDSATAFSAFLDAARKTGDARLYRRAVDVALQSHAGDAAMQAARAWVAAQPASLEANHYLLQILVGMNRPRETLEPLKREIASVAPEQRTQALLSIPRQFARITDKKAATVVVEQALKGYLDNPATAGTAWSVLGRMQLAAGDTSAAQASANRSMTDNRPANGAALLAVELMAQKLAAGEALLLKCLQSDSDPELRMAYVRLLLQAQRYADAATQTSLLVEQRPDYGAAWLIQGSLQQQNQQYEQAQASLLRYLALVKDEGADPAAEERLRGTLQAYLSLADIAMQRNDYAAAQAWLDRVPPSQETSGVQSRRASLLARQGKLEEARQLIRALPQRDAEEARSKLLMEAQLLRDAQQLRAAYDLLRSAPSDKADPEILYEQAMLAEKLGEFGEMERLLRAVIAARPDYQHAYNALGYSFAERNERLPEAKQLIETALKFAPGDPFISDSLGWVEFRLGNKDAAARILETAYRSRPDAEIAAHLGEVLWSMGQTSRAVAVWKEGLQLNPKNDTLSETLKRLKVKW